MAVSQVDFGVAMALGVGPALGVMFLSLRRFDRPFTDYTLFDDRRVFFGLAMGMIFGVLAAFLTVNIGDFGFLVALVALFAVLLFEEMFKLVYLNRRRYRQRFDTTFYGVSLGAGIASTGVVGSVLASSSTLFTVETMGLLVLFSLNQSLIHVDSGVFIGFGATRGDMWVALEKAVAIRYGHMILLIWFIMQAPEPWSLVSSVTALGFAALVYHYVYTQLLPGTIPEDVQREMRRSRRSKAAKD